ncbi:MAG TPA: hypothetical protein DHV15_10275 [Treponema sp.]|uniref:Uncharacterized protein n=1 Tax=Treponema denticola (strain ATCC 35405 / DSM 14222 / CIP 103919 / JCM 8153 / KCTC 15104) TaxID=243275 RepID=Q73LD1_TREDE|nr:hypothetical protein TDE_1934 [Treponema denticola ATCC 35405]HCY95874.1 hypothetical protein [Treponema sp.]
MLKRTKVTEKELWLLAEKCTSVYIFQLRVLPYGKTS